MFKLKIRHLYRFASLIIVILIISTLFLLGVYTYRNIEETITATARLIELRPEIAITEQLDSAAWVKIQEKMQGEANEQAALDYKAIRDPFTP